jgi:GWxTD domain-containing protein
MKTLFFLLIAYSFVAYSQVESKGAKENRLAQPNFYQDVLNFASSDTSNTRVDIFIQIPYPEIKFIKTEGGFGAAYSVTVSVFDEGKEKLITERTWNEKVETIDFSQTITKNNYSLSLKSFNLRPASYTIRVAVEDRESKRVYTSENKFVVRNLNKKAALSDFIIIAKQTSADGGNKIIPSVSRNVATQKSGLPLFFEVYSDTARAAFLQYTIISKQKKVMVDTFEVRNLQKGKNQVFFTVKTPPLPLGEYAVTVTVKDEKKETLDMVAKGFISKWIGVPNNISDLDKAIEQMLYIASDKEMKYIKEAPSEQEKAQRFAEYWKKKDPSPATEENEIFDEYYARVAYANENFSHYNEGWRSDMGMVFILLGPPSNVDRHPFDYDSKPYEIWQYYDLNKEFIFLDSTGFGDYRLITPLYGDTYRFRN